MLNAPIPEMLRAIEKTVQESVPHTEGELAPVAEMLRYSLESGGKRVRPLLTLLFCEAAGGEWKNALRFAAAVEFVHTYSLIHDDLPCMDNDDYRRGRLSSHKKFGEANALLAGDALLTHAFYLIAEAAAAGDVTAAQSAAAAKELSRLAGADGMVGGQYIDLAYENKAAGADTLFTMDRLKTACLIEAAAVLGCIAAGTDETVLNAARTFAVGLGLAFQITDDLLEYNDETNSDVENGKSTYVSVFGFEKARALAAEYTEKAVAALTVFGEKGETLKEFALTLLNRTK
jgi:geranylgeranyl diphosphate synthase type II